MNGGVRAKNAFQVRFPDKSIAMGPRQIDSPWGDSDYHGLSAWIEASPGGFIESGDFVIGFYDCYTLEYVFFRDK